MGTSAWPRYGISFASSAALVFLCLAVHVNETTVSLAMLLLVLGIATKWGLRQGVFTSLICVFAFNFFFLPPVGTLTIADPQNWVALTAFLVSAVVASQLSAKAKSRAEESLARRAEVERLYELSRVMLMDEETNLTRSALGPIRDIFGLAHVVFYDAESGEVHPADAGPLSRVALEQVARSNESEQRDHATYIPVRLGARVIGSLGFSGPVLSRPEQESIANLVAIGYERIRALKRAAEAETARESERLKTFVLDGIAHDLKTPLTAIKTCVTTLITIAPQSEEKRNELLSIIDEEAERLHTTITEAIQLARVESAKVSLQRATVSLRDMLDRLLLTVHDPDRIVVHLAPPDVHISADAELLSQALRQLIENAAKYSRADAAIEIEAEYIFEKVLIKVSDRGPGINPREIERIFEKFYRGTRGRMDSQATGMGLAIARGIIEAHGGRVWAENRPGGGAVFVIQLANP